MEFQAWYLYDGTLTGDIEHIAIALKIIQHDGPALRIVLNVVKTELFWPIVDPRCSDSDLFPPGIYVLGLELGYLVELSLLMLPLSRALFQTHRKVP